MMDEILLDPDVDLVEAQRRLQEAVDRNDPQSAADLSLLVATRDPASAHAQRVASGYLTAADRAQDAIPHARRALELAPDNREYALHLGIVLNLSGRFDEAAKVLMKVARMAPVDPETYLQLANASEKLGYNDAAAKFALQSSREEPENENRRLIVAHFLVRLGETDEAIRTLMEAGAHAQLSNGALGTLSALLGQAGRFEEALEPIDKALAQEPGRADFHLHRSWLLMQLGRLQDALGAARRAVELDPANASARRHAVTVLIENGEIEEALRHGGALLSQFPGEDEYISCMSYLIDARAARGAAESFSEIALLKRDAPRRELPPPPTFVDKLRTQRRSISALVLREMRGRNGESKLGFFWTLMEPFIHVGALAIVFEFTMHGRPPLGDNFFFFYFTGVMPYLMVSHLVLHLGHAARNNKHLLQIAQVTPFDLMVSTSIVEIFTSLLIYLIFSGLFAVFGVDPTPASLPLVAEAFAIAAVLGVGCGMLCAALFEFGQLGESFVSIFIRLIYFASGIFYVPSAMPVFVRDILAYNPLLHGIDAMRMGYFSGYNPPWNDIGYAAIFAVMTLALGMLAVNVLSQRMRSIK